jgi:hypothetical protein
MDGMKIKWRKESTKTNRTVKTVMRPRRLALL